MTTLLPIGKQTPTLHILHRPLRFLLNVFTKFSELRDKKIILIKRAQTCYLLSERSGCYHSTSKTHVRDSPIHALVIYQISCIIRFPEFAEITEFNESSAPFRKNSIALSGFQCRPRYRQLYTAPPKQRYAPTQITHRGTRLDSFTEITNKTKSIYLSL